jgi:hypothetical protein
LSFVTIASAYIEADDDAKEVGWWPLADLPDLAFDHKDIIVESLKMVPECN